MPNFPGEPASTMDTSATWQVDDDGRDWRTLPGSGANLGSVTSRTPLPRPSMTWLISMDPARMAINRSMGNRFKERDIKKAQDEIAWEMKIHPDTYGFISELDKSMRFRCELRFRFTNWRWDIDGPIKRVLDGVGFGMEAAGADWFDDRNIVELRVWKETGSHPGLAITLEAI